MEIDIKKDDLIIVQAILKKCLPPGSRVWVFGSRAQSRAKTFSDLDLAFDFGRKITLEEFTSITRAFGDSVLPYKVDVVDLWTVEDSFKKIIDQEKKPFCNDPSN